MKAILLESYEPMRRLLTQKLTEVGCTIQQCTSVDDILPHIPDADIALVDYETTGAQLRAITDRFADAEIPIVMMVSKTSDTTEYHTRVDRAAALVERPFDIAELYEVITRLTAERSLPDRIEIDGLAADKAQCCAELNGTALQLGAKEIGILHLLMGQCGKPISRSRIMDEIWHSGQCASRRIDMHITHLRNALGEYGKRIVTVHGEGYMFI